MSVKRKLVACISIVLVAVAAFAWLRSTWTHESFHEPFGTVDVGDAGASLRALPPDHEPAPEGVAVPPEQVEPLRESAREPEPIEWEDEEPDEEPEVEPLPRTLIVHVEDGLGRSLAGAELTVYGDEGGTFVSDSAGVARIPHPDQKPLRGSRPPERSPLCFQVNAPGFAAVSCCVEKADFGNADTFELHVALPAAAAVLVRIVDAASGDPIAGAEVIPAYGTQNPPLPHSGVEIWPHNSILSADANGRIAFDALIAGTWSFIAWDYRSWWQSERVAVDVQVGERAEIELRMESMTIDGHASGYVVLPPGEELPQGLQMKPGPSYGGFLVHADGAFFVPLPQGVTKTFILYDRESPRSEPVDLHAGLHGVPVRYLSAAELEER